MKADVVSANGEHLVSMRPNSALCDEPSAVAVRQVSKVFRAADGSEVTALAGLSLTVNAGEMVAIVGPSGWARSTSSRACACKTRFFEFGKPVAPPCFS